MKHWKLIGLLALLVTLGGVLTGCKHREHVKVTHQHGDADKSGHHGKKADGDKSTAALPNCAVSGEPVKNKDVSSTYKGKTYYFCCPNCKGAFDGNPEKFAAK